MSTNPPQPDSPEDILIELWNTVDAEDVQEELIDIGAIGDAKDKLDAYYTNKFLECLPPKEHLDLPQITQEYVHGYNQALRRVRQAIKQLSKRGE